jgi:chromosome partitioning protein
MARVIAICNAKGGVGKTTTAVNLGAYLAVGGKRVLLVDFDPQGNASSALGYNPLHVEWSVYHGILGEKSAADLIKPSIIYNFHLVPSAPHLAGALVELVGLENREYRLRNFLHHVRHEYDYIIIDLSPSLTLLTINALMAADEVIVPVQAEYYSLEGLGQLLQTIELLQKNLEHPVKIAGAVLTMTNPEEKLAREVAENLRQHFPHYVFKTEIPRSIPLAEAPSYARPVILHRPDSPGAVAYQELAREIVSQELMNSAVINERASADFGNFNV